MKNLTTIALAIGVVASLTTTAVDARNTTIYIKNCSNKAHTFKIKDGKNSNLGYTRHLRSGTTQTVSCRGRGKGRCKLEVKQKGWAHYKNGPKIKRGKTAFYLGKDTWSERSCG